MRRAAELTPTSKTRKTFAGPAPLAPPPAPPPAAGVPYTPPLPPPPPQQQQQEICVPALRALLPPPPPPFHHRGVAAVPVSTTSTSTIGSGIGNVGGKSSTTPPPPPPLPPPHVSSTQIPTLSSAPPSIGLQQSTSHDSSNDNDDIYNSDDESVYCNDSVVSFQADFNMAAVGINMATTTTNTTSSNMTTLPPPPPPAPTVVGSTSATAASSKYTTTRSTAGTVVPLPPPPPPKPAAAAVVGTAFAASTASSTSATTTATGAGRSPPPPRRAASPKSSSTTTFAATPTMVPLPPPPIMSMTSKSTTTTPKPATPPPPPPPPPAPPAVAVSPETVVMMNRPKPVKPKPLSRTAFLQQQQQQGGGGGGIGAARGGGGNGGGNNNVSLLARRQTHFGVAIVATESAHMLAWKNGLQLPDLLNGLVQNIANLQGNKTAAQPLPPFRSITRALTLNWSDMLVYFYNAQDDDDNDDSDEVNIESIKRALASDSTTSTTNSSSSAAAANNNNAAATTAYYGQKMNPHDAHGVAAELQRSAALQNSDGNLQYELDLLEDQVDNLLQDHHYGQEQNIAGAAAGHGGDDGGHYFRSSGGSHDNVHGSSGASGNDHGQYDLEARQRQYEQVAKDAFCLTSPPNIPWLWRYRQALDASTDNLEHDMLSCPNVVLLVCTTHEQAAAAAITGMSSSSSSSSSPLEALRALQSPHYLPANFHNGLWNPNPVVPNNSSLNALNSASSNSSSTTTAGGVRYEVLVLHDVMEGPKNWNEAAFIHTLQSSFGPSATVLRINSIPPEKAAVLAQEEKHDWWGCSGKAGNCLSLSDRVVMRKWLASFISDGLLPAMERRITDLNIIVSDRKKGVRNVLKSFWRGTTTTTSTNTSSGGGGASGSSSKHNDDDNMGSDNAGGGGVGTVQVKYRYDTIESQTRLLADSLFLMRDYDGALGTYRLIKDDYKQDKAMAHYGSCQEMMALCMHLLDPYGKSREVFSNIENALLSYSKASDRERAIMAQQQQQQPTPGRPTASVPCTRLATRLCLVLSSSRQICSGRYLEVADLLASASSNETSLGAAVLLEQSSAHYFRAEMYRKYAFHMLMSGHMFRSAGQENHAFRCFTSALYIYRDSQWDELHNHLRSALAAQLYSTGRMSLSLQLYAKLVGSSAGGRVSTKSQQKFVQHLLEICNGHAKKALAGADRMAAPSRLTGSARDRYRQERLDRIVQVVQFTKCASRVLELPNIDLPFIDDKTVVVLGEEEATEASSGIIDCNINLDASATATNDSQQAAAQPTIGISCRGDEEVWDQLTLETIGELRAFNNAKNQQQQNDELVTKVLAQIEDREIRSVISEIDKEKANRNLLDRAKRSATYKATPPVRALMEPLTVEFEMSNPLGIPIDCVDMQLVACMTDSEDVRRLCTNEDAIKIKPLVSSNEDKKWTFHSSAMVFYVADFCRVLCDSASSTANKRWKAAGEDIDPFFVVTKSSISLEPESRKTVALSICPIIEGDLQIIGVRSRLFDDVWVFHPFDVKGELLQNTRSNRANRVRGESLILKAKVEKGMPCLTAELAMPPSMMHDGNAAGPVLQGQVSKWNLRLSNVGTAPAKHITLKTNLPWVNLWKGVRLTDAEDDKKTATSDIEKESTSFSVGPSGTLLNIPIDGLGLAVDGTIQPGESVDIAVDIRSSGTGKQDFYLLFRYELAEDGGPSRHRWLRRMFQVPVYPSLTLGAAVIPSFSKTAEHILSIELTNYRTDRPEKLQLMLESLNLASRAYKLEPLHGQLDGAGVLRLGWQERVTLHYRIVPLDETSSTCLLSQCDLSGLGDEAVTSLAASSSSLLDFLCLERANNQFRETLLSHQMALARAAAAQHHEENQPRSISQIRRANTSALSGKESGSLSECDDKGHATSIRRLTPFEGSLESVVLLCCWENQDGTIKGQHYIRDLTVRPATESSSSSSSSLWECPITITGRHPVTVQNNFHDGPANVSFEVTLRNRLTVAPVDFEFALDQPENFDLSGPECFKWELGAGEEIKVPLQALIPSVGTFNLQKVRLTIDHDGPVSYHFPFQWMVSVEQASE